MPNIIVSSGIDQFMQSADPAAARSVLGLGDSALKNVGTGAAQVASGNHSHSSFIGDTGSGGVAGFVPAPSAGDALAGKYLDADGGWTVPAGVSSSDSSVLDIIAVTQAEYDAITTPSATTLYLITD